MAKHEFGIMNTDPEPNERYDTYEPERYDCVSVHDDYIEPLLGEFSAVDCYWHTLARPEKGLAYCGITLIPASSLEPLIAILDGTTGTEELQDLFLLAKAKKKFVIHFGI